MEQLLSDADKQGRPRSLTLADLRSWGDWPNLADRLSRQDSEGFGVLLATAEGVDISAVETLARWAIPRGIYAVSFWGPGCEIAHDTFEEIEVILQIDAGVVTEDQSVVMSTWHAEESLEETLDYFWECAIVDDGKIYGPRRIVLAISPDGQIAEQVRTWASAH